ncbi:MAG: amidohydrolase, partial [Hyphomonas sp.]
MTYASGRLIHDADSHLMEPVDCLDPYFDKRLLARFRETPQMRELLAERADWIRERLDLQSDADFRADADGELMVRKNYEAQGAWLRDDRPHALDGL